MLVCMYVRLYTSGCVYFLHVVCVCVFVCDCVWRVCGVYMGGVASVSVNESAEN